MQILSAIRNNRFLQGIDRTAIGFNTEHARIATFGQNKPSNIDLKNQKQMFSNFDKVFFSSLEWVHVRVWVRII
jgi:hypothetical protein